MDSLLAGSISFIGSISHSPVAPNVRDVRFLLFLAVVSVSVWVVVLITAIFRYSALVFYRQSRLSKRERRSTV